MPITFMLKRISQLMAVLVVTGCASGATDRDLVADPLEDVNRSIHAVNKGLDQAILRPAADVYDVTTPTLFKHVFGNAVSHLRFRACS